MKISIKKSMIKKLKKAPNNNYIVFVMGQYGLNRLSTKWFLNDKEFNPDKQYPEVMLKNYYTNNEFLRRFDYNVVFDIELTKNNVFEISFCKYLPNNEKICFFGAKAKSIEKQQHANVLLIEIIVDAHYLSNIFEIYLLEAFSQINKDLDMNISLLKFTKECTLSPLI